MKALPAIGIALLAAALGATGGYALCDRRAQRDEAAMSLSHNLGTAASAQFTLLMLEQNRAPQLISVLERRLAESLHAVRSQLPAVNPEVYAAWPNLIESARRSGEYFQRAGRLPEAAQDGAAIASLMSHRAADSHSQVPKTP